MAVAPKMSEADIVPFQLLIDLIPNRALYSVRSFEAHSSLVSLNQIKAQNHKLATRRSMIAQRLTEPKRRPSV
jgi:hypothetical protein